MDTIKKTKREHVHPRITEFKEIIRGGKIARRALVRHAAVLGVSLSIIGASLVGAATPAVAADDPVRGGTLRTEYNWIPYTEDPATDGIGTGLVGLSIAESLIWVGESGAPQPQLIKSWETNADSTEWILHLQEGVTFNNGKAFGADDVIWNLNHWMDPDVGSSLGAALDFLSPEGITKIDDLTIKLSLDRPNADVLLAFYDYPSMIAPEGGWTDFYSGDPADAIGTGPFMLSEFTPDERMVLVRNPNYWRKGADGQSLPYLDKVVVTAGWDDATRLAALIAGEAEILSPRAGIIEELQKYPNEINIVPRLTGWVTPIVMRVDMPPFDDVRVRNALRLVQDRAKIQQLVMPLGPVGYDHWIPSTDPSYCAAADAGGLPQDIEKAKALLAEAGYPDGLDLELSLSDDSHRPAYAQVYKEMAAQAGINISLNMLPSSAFWDKWQQWPFSISGWNGRIPATKNISLAMRCGAGWTESYYCNEELDALLDASDGTVDVEKKRELFCQIQDIMQEDSGYLIPFWAASYSANRTNVHLPDTWSRGGFLWHQMWLTD
ncbi:MAG: ABC transporter substrate-binding protein [Alphaproteobacteria bacterium]|jgi:peptide/nickel transport system substrate-binding protein